MLRACRRRRDRGVSLVEAAFVLPVVVLFVFGVIEYGLYFSTTAGATSATRTGARTAATEFAPAADKNVAVDLIRRSVEGAMESMTGLATPLELLVYSADSEGRPPGGSFSSCVTECYRFTWDGTQFVRNGGSGWPANQVDACIGSEGGGPDLDSIGVYLRVEHDLITGLFGGSRIVAHKTALRIEPLPLEQCGP
jgi:hypothetical protein